MIDNPQAEEERIRALAQLSDILSKAEASDIDADKANQRASKMPPLIDGKFATEGTFER